MSDQKINVSLKTIKAAAWAIDLFSESWRILYPDRQDELTDALAELNKLQQAASQRNESKSSAAELWATWEAKFSGLDSGYTYPEMYYFAVRNDPNGEEGTYELYLCNKASYLENNNRFVWDEGAGTYLGRIVGLPDDALGETTDTDGCVLWNVGDMEKARLSLIEAGFEEKSEMLETLRSYPEDEPFEDGDWA